MGHGVAAPPTRQLRLDGYVPPVNRLEHRYRVWMVAHPEVLALFRRFAREAMQAGRRFGIGLLAERVRWEARMTWAKDKAGFKLDNNHRAYIARQLLQEIPGLAGLVETRRVRGEADDS